MHAVRRSHAGLRIVTACAAMLFACGAAADEPQAYEIDAGFDAAPQSLYWYSEAITALNRDMAKDGFLSRVYGSLAVYQYAGTAIDGTVDGTLWQLDLTSPGSSFHSLPTSPTGRGEGRPYCCNLSHGERSVGRAASATAG
jgi:hypothetical protein